VTPQEKHCGRQLLYLRHRAGRKKRGGGQVPPGAVHLFHPSFQATLMAGYDVNLHREYYGFHLMAQSFGEPLCFLIDGDAGYPGGLDGNYSDDQHCLRYVSLRRVKAIAEILSSLSFTQFVERGYAAFPPDHEMQAFPLVRAKVVVLLR